MKRAAARRSAGPSKRVTVEQILSEHTPRVRRLAESLRTLIKEALPEALEVAHPGWHGIGYRHPEAGFVCAIFPRKDDVRLGFEHGARLDDHEKLLDGGGNQVRYVTVEDSRDMHTEALRRLVREAVHIQSMARNA